MRAKLDTPAHEAALGSHRPAQHGHLGTAACRLICAPVFCYGASAAGKEGGNCETEPSRTPGPRDPGASLMF